MSAPQPSFRAAGRPQPDDLAAGLRLAIICPCSHKLAPLFQRIAAPVSLFRLVANDVRKRRLGKLACEMRLVAGPIAEGGPEAMRGYANAHAAQEHVQRHHGKRLFGPLARKEEIACPRLGKRFEDRQRRAQRGTRCSRPAFIRFAGTVQTLPVKSISSQSRPRISPERAAVKMQNSSASAAIPSRSRKSAIKAGTSA